MISKDYKIMIKSINRIYKLIGNYIEFYNNDKPVHNDHDFEISLIELKQLFADLKGKNIFIEDRIIELSNQLKRKQSK